jgi:hypothetical protein
MSTPVVAGGVALWLQANPRLTQQEVKQVLSRTCRHPESGLRYPNNYYGYGEIDVYRGLLDVLQMDGVEGIDVQLPGDMRIVPNGHGLQLLMGRQSAAATLTVKVFGLGGAEVCKLTQPLSGREAYVALPVLPAGVYAVQVMADGRVLGSQLVRL